jgi:plasmid stabilization system protein ParE
MIFYRLEPQTVRVLRILHAARDVTPDLLSE